MKSSTGRWVSGDDFFDRVSELRILEEQIRAGNHVLLTGQRRMGKTSAAQELGRQLKSDGWLFLFTDVEGATCAEDVIADIAQAAYPVRGKLAHFATATKRWISDNIEEVSALDFHVKLRAGLNAGNWRRYGETLLRDCAEYDKPVLLVIDELSIFLKRMLRGDDGTRRVEEFLSWLRSTVQKLGDRSPVFIISGSIGLAPLVRRLGIPDRINHLYPFRLEPWSRDASVACFERLAQSHQLSVDDGVATAVYEALGIGVPHQVQSFFARLRDFAVMNARERVTVEDVGEVYRKELLGPSGQNDLVHYDTRLKEGLEDEKSYTIAMEILAEAATQDVFTADAQQCLDRVYSTVISDTQERIGEVLEILVHDGYLQEAEDGLRFPSHLLKDWWSARFRDHHTPLRNRGSHDA